MCMEPIALALGTEEEQTTEEESIVTRTKEEMAGVRTREEVGITEEEEIVEAEEEETTLEIFKGGTKPKPSIT